MQFNQIKDYLNKGDGEVFTKCIVPFLKVDKHLESGEIEPTSLGPLLDSCLANWLENHTATQELVLDSLEDAIEKYVTHALGLQHNNHKSVSDECLCVPTWQQANGMKTGISTRPQPGNRDCRHMESLVSGTDCCANATIDSIFVQGAGGAGGGAHQA